MVHFSYRAAEAAIKRAYQDPSDALIEEARQRVYDRTVSDDGELIDRFNMIDTTSIAEELRILLDDTGDHLHAARTLASLLHQSLMRHAVICQDEELQKMQTEDEGQLADTFLEVA